MDLLSEAEQLQAMLPLAAEDWANFLNEAPSSGDTGLVPMNGGVPNFNAPEMDFGFGFSFDDRPQQGNFESTPFEADLFRPGISEPNLLDTPYYDIGTQNQSIFYGNDILRPNVFANTFYRPENIGPSHLEFECLDFEPSVAQGSRLSFGSFDNSQEVQLSLFGVDDQSYDQLAPPLTASELDQSGVSSSVAFSNPLERHFGELETQFPQLATAVANLETVNLRINTLRQLSPPDSNLALVIPPLCVSQSNDLSFMIAPEHPASIENSYEGASIARGEIPSQPWIPQSNTINALTTEIEASLLPSTIDSSPTTVCDVRTMPQSNIPPQTLKEPTPTDWVMLRPIVYSLYIHRGHHLNLVVKILKEKFGFKTSEKMLKDRVKLWGQIKNLTQRDKEGIKRRIEIRKLAQKRSEVRFYGRLLSSDEIVRRESRKPLAIRDEVARIRSSTPPGIRVYTPPASPLSTPPILGLPEQILKSITEYIPAAFEAKIWVSTGELDCIGSQRQTYRRLEVINDMHAAVFYYDYSLTEQVERIILRVQRDSEQLVTMQNEDITTNLVFCIYEYTQKGKLQHVMSTIQAMSITATRVLGPVHPIARILALMCSYLGEEEDSTLLTALNNIAARAVDSFEDALGHAHYSALLYRLNYIHIFVLHRDFECGLSILRKLTHMCDKLGHGLEDERSLLVSMYLMRWLTYSGYREHWQEAASIAADLIEKSQQRKLSFDVIRPYQADIHRHLGDVYMRLGQVEAGKAYLRKAIHFALSVHGAQHAITFSYRNTLEAWLRDCGCSAEADEVKKQIDSYEIDF